MKIIVRTTDEASVIIREIEISCATNHELLRKKLATIVLDFKDFDISQFKKNDPFSVTYKNQMVRLFEALRKDKYTPSSVRIRTQSADRFASSARLNSHPKCG